MLDWMMRLDREQSIIFTQELVALREDPEMDTYVNTLEWYFTERGIEQGKQLGIEQGKQLGIEQGKLTLLRSQLERRFGKLPAWAQVRLDHGSPPEIGRWSLQLLEVGRLEDVFA